MRPICNLATTRAVVISEGIARRYWPDRSPIGAQIRLVGRPATIVGVAADVKRRSLGVASDPVLWISLLQPPRWALPDVWVVARTAGDPATLLPAMRRAVMSVDTRIPVAEASTVRALMRASASEERCRTLLMLVFGVLACVQAAVGVFGV